MALSIPAAHDLALHGSGRRALRELALRVLARRGVGGTERKAGNGHDSSDPKHITLPSVLDDPARGDLKTQGGAAKKRPEIWGVELFSLDDHPCGTYSCWPDPIHDGDTIQCGSERVWISNTGPAALHRLHQQAEQRAAPDLRQSANDPCNEGAMHRKRPEMRAPKEVPNVCK
jgi:hypothetical protein